jgi:hypothetical protein
MNPKTIHLKIAQRNSKQITDHMQEHIFEERHNSSMVVHFETQRLFEEFQVASSGEHVDGVLFVMGPSQVSSRDEPPESVASPPDEIAADRRSI